MPSALHIITTTKLTLPLSLAQSMLLSFTAQLLKAELSLLAPHFTSGLVNGRSSGQVTNAYASLLRPLSYRTFFTQVNVSVNGELIPFNMKIGEAGEAFFVFETEDDVPEDLITSPILLPTRPEVAASVQGPAAIGMETPVNEEDRVSRLDRTPEAPELRREGARLRVTSEPEFLDLDAGSGVEETPRPPYDIPLYAQADTSTSDVTASMIEQDKRVDKMLENCSKVEVERPDVEYHEGSYKRCFFHQLSQLQMI